MRSQPLLGEASRRRAEEQFKTTKKVNSENTANTPSRQAEAAKTARLRALRLAKEAADKDIAIGLVRLTQLGRGPSWVKA